MKYYPKFNIVCETAKGTSALVWEVSGSDLLASSQSSQGDAFASLQGLHKTHREDSVPDWTEAKSNSLPIHSYWT